MRKEKTTPEPQGLAAYIGREISKTRPNSRGRVIDYYYNAIDEPMFIVEAQTPMGTHLRTVPVDGVLIHPKE